MADIRVDSAAVRFGSTIANPRFRGLAPERQGRWPTHRCR